MAIELSLAEKLAIRRAETEAEIKRLRRERELARQQRAVPFSSRGPGVSQTKLGGVPGTVSGTVFERDNNTGGRVEARSPYRKS